MKLRKYIVITYHHQNLNSLITMGEECSKPVKHRKFDHPIILNSNKTGILLVLWNYTTYDVIPSTSSKHPNVIF